MAGHVIGEKMGSWRVILKGGIRMSGRKTCVPMLVVVSRSGTFLLLCSHPPTLFPLLFFFSFPFLWYQERREARARDILVPRREAL